MTGFYVFAGTLTLLVLLALYVLLQDLIEETIGAIRVRVRVPARAKVAQPEDRRRQLDAVMHAGER